MKKLVVQNLLKVWLCAMVSFMTVTLYAQGNSFKVSGTVKDNTGELVIGATVIDTKNKKWMCDGTLMVNFFFRGDAKFVD